MRISRKGFLPLLVFEGAIVFLCALVTVASKPVSYTVTEIGGLSGTKFASVTDINGSGKIVGSSANHAFLWDHGVVTDLGTLGGNLSVANAVNDLGQVVGESNTATGEKHAFLWEQGVMTDLGTAGETSAAHGINNLGQIVGAAFAKNVRGGAMLWKNGVRQPLGDLGPSGSGSTAMAVSDKAEIVGVSSGFVANLGGVVRAVVWQGGTIQEIGTLGGRHSAANALNGKREVVGWAEMGDQSTDAFLWQGGRMHDLGKLPGSLAKAGAGSQAAGINDHGVIVGSSLNSKGESRAVIWEFGQIRDLNDLIPQESGIILTAAKAINLQGQIVAEQQLGPEGPTASFLLTPRP